ncbi:hypothetical protein C8R44DRAFT_885235 [Mycena epipterygia]|nr:hypothetical protein C8R44DRAFT_885235 [Mycena epipterygia]
MAVLRYDPIIPCDRSFLPPSSPNLPFSLRLELPPPSRGAPIHTSSLVLNTIAESAGPPRAYPRAASRSPPPTQVHRHRARAPTACSSARGACARAAGEPRPADGGGGTSAASSFSTAWACWGRGACSADAGNAGCSSADVDPEAPVPTLDVALELLSVDQKTNALLPPATPLPTSQGRMLRFVPRDEDKNVVGVSPSLPSFRPLLAIMFYLMRPPARPYDPAETTTKPERGRTRRVRSGGGLLLSGDDLELEIRGLAPASR